jgi:hypothetical protein
MAAVVIDAFAFTARYVDDLLSIANLLFPSLIHEADQWHGVQGLYPAALELKIAARGRRVPYMDIFLTADAKGVGFFGGFCGFCLQVRRACMISVCMGP